MERDLPNVQGGAPGVSAVVQDGVVRLGQDVNVCHTPRVVTWEYGVERGHTIRV